MKPLSVQHPGVSGSRAPERPASARTAAPLVSIIVHVSGGETPVQVRATLDSLRQQTWSDFEVVVVTSQMSEHLADEVEILAAERLSVAVVCHASFEQNPASGHLAAIQGSAGSLVILSGATTSYVPEALSLLCRPLLEDGVTVAIGRCRLGVETVPDGDDWFPESIRYRRIARIEATAFRRSLVDRAGFPDPRPEMAEVWDWDFLRRLLWYGRAHCIGSLVATSSSGASGESPNVPFLFAIPSSPAARGLLPRQVDPSAIPEPCWSSSELVRRRRPRARARSTISRNGPVTRARAPSETRRRTSL